MADTVWPSMRETKAGIVVGYAHEKRQLIDYLRTIPEEDWSNPTLHPEWDVRGVVSRLWGQAHDFLDVKIRKETTKANKQGADAIIPLMTEATERHLSTGAKMTIRELLAQCEYVRSIVAVRLAQIPTTLFSLMRIKGMIPMKLYEAMGILLMDAWVYRNDIQRSRGDVERGGFYKVLLPAAFFGVEHMRSYNPESPINLEINGYGEWSLVPNAGFAKGFHANAPAKVRMDPDEFLMVASGRVQADDARAEIEGNRGLGMEFLYSIRYMGLAPGF